MKELNLKAGDLDILIGGPPCQGFSSAGTRFWDDPRNHLLKRYVRVLETLKPKWFLMENVEGLLTSNGGKYVYETVKAFIELGYSVRIEKVYAHEFGVPQRRKRVIIVGNSLGIDFAFPKSMNAARGHMFKFSDFTLENSIGDLITKYELQDHQPCNLDPALLNKISLLKEGQTMRDLPEEMQHPSYRARANRRVKDGTPSEKRGGPPSGLKRLVWNQPSLTITSAATREFIHPVLNRFLTVRECARIQTFPDDFIFIGNAADKIKQIGNAIPPQLAQVFASHIRGFGFITKEETDGKLLGFSLTKSNGLSPALEMTKELLTFLMVAKQQTLFKHAS
jgi:DNA (cytosine-5)-methyltransferase 1